MSKRTYIVWDARYTFDPDRAAVMVACDSLDEAKRSAPDYGLGCVVTDERGTVLYTVPIDGKPRRKAKRRKGANHG